MGTNTTITVHAAPYFALVLCIVLAHSGRQMALYQLIGHLSHPARGPALSE